MSCITLLFVSFAILVSVTAYDGELNVEGTPVRAVSYFSLKTFDKSNEDESKDDEKCENSKFSCINPCNNPEMQYCAKKGADPIKSTCGKGEVCRENSGNLECIPEGSAVCDNVVFKCPSSSRFYPNINDCQSYYYCNKKDEEAQLYRCPANFAYDPVRHNCGPMALGVKCLTVTCPAQPKLLPYIGDRSLYVVCMAGRGTLTECEDPEEFSLSTGSCVAQCRLRGLFAYKNDETCRKFYTCLRPNSEPIRDQCPEGTIFNQTAQSCNRGKCDKKPQD